MSARLRIDMVEYKTLCLNTAAPLLTPQVDIRLSFDAAASEARARRIIAMYEVRGLRFGQ